MDFRLGEKDESKILWPHGINAVLGLWLASGVFIIEPHPWTLFWSDVLSGVLIVVLSFVACWRRNEWAKWCVGVVGLWLMFAPFVFWAPTAASYATDTLIGSLVVGFALLIPGTLRNPDTSGPEAPTGWTYNPSAWTQRVGIIACAFLQFYIARPMAAFQLGHTNEIWDPVFGDGTRRVLESDVSKSFPVSDAGLGAVTYLVEALTGFLGGTRRWRTMPWAVILFGIMIVPVGVVSIVLVMLQPVAVGAWCFWCLMTAALTVVMIGPALDEVLATAQFLIQARRNGQSVWSAFWRGGTVADQETDVRPGPSASLARELAGGLEWLTIPWNLAVSVALGLWLMAAPVVLGNVGMSANNNHIIGALVVTFAFIGFSEAGRGARWLNLLMGTWIVIAPNILSGSNSASWWNDVAIGLAVILLTFRKGRVEERFGGWDRFVV